MAEQKIKKLIFPNGSDLAVFDIENLETSIETDLSEVNSRLDALESGSRQFAFADYTQTANQEEMTQLVYYYVPFTTDGTFVQLGSDGKPTGDAEIAYFVVMFKSSDDVVSEVTIQYTNGNLEGVAYTAADNEFTGDNTFSGTISKTTSGTFDDLGSNELVTKAEVQEKITALELEVAGIDSATTESEGIIEIATEEEALAGTDTARAITPATLKAYVDDFAEDVATQSGDNAFTGTNTFTTGDSTVTISGTGVSASSQDSDLVLGSGTTQVTISSDGSITRTAMPSEAGDTELVTKGYVDDAITNVSVDAATETTAGIIRIATETETIAGEDATIAVTPSYLSSKLDDFVQIITEDQESSIDTTKQAFYVVVESTSNE